MFLTYTLLIRLMRDLLSFGSNLIDWESGSAADPSIALTAEAASSKQIKPYPLEE
jgi:hypothetical protein